MAICYSGTNGESLYARSLFLESAGAGGDYLLTVMQGGGFVGMLAPGLPTQVLTVDANGHLAWGAGAGGGGAVTPHISTHFYPGGSDSTDPHNLGAATLTDMNSAISNHVAAADPHTAYYNQARGDARYSQLLHNILTGHAVTGSANQIVGLTATNTLGLLTGTATVGAGQVPVGGTAGAISWSGLQTFNAGATVAALQNLNFGADVTLTRKNANVLSPGTGDAIESASYFAGNNGYHIDDTYAEFGNIRARGEFRASVYAIGETLNIAGSQVVARSGGKLDVDFVVSAGSPPFSNIAHLILTNPATGGWLASTGDIVQIKSVVGGSASSTWMTVTRTGTVNEYTATVNYGSVNMTYPAGIGVTVWGQAGQGFWGVSADGTFGSGATWLLGTLTATPWLGSTPNVWAATDGKLYAGGGNLSLDAQGVKVKATSAFYTNESSYQLINTNNVVIGGYGGYYDAVGGNHGLDVRCNNIGGQSSSITLNSDAPLDKIASVSISATRGPSLPNWVSIQLNSSSVSQGNWIQLNADYITLRGAVTSYGLTADSLTSSSSVTARTLSLSGTASSGNAATVAGTFTSTTTVSNYGVYSSVVLAPNNPSSATLMGVRGIADGSSVYDLTGSIFGVYGYARNLNTGTANLLAGIVGAASIGAGGGNVTAAEGALFQVINGEAGATLATAMGVNVSSPTATGPITTAYGVYISAQKVSGVTNGYGLYIVSQGTGYAIYSAGGKVRLAGLSAYANNAAAIAGGLAAGDLYRTNGDPDSVCVVH